MHEHEMSAAAIWAETERLAKAMGYISFAHMPARKREQVERWAPHVLASRLAGLDEFPMDERGEHQ